MFQFLTTHFRITRCKTPQPGKGQYLGKIAGISVEGSYQAQRRGVLVDDGEGGTQPLFAQMGRVGVMPFLSPGGRGNFTRPHIPAYRTTADGRVGIIAEGGNARFGLMIPVRTVIDPRTANASTQCWTKSPP